MSRRTKKIGSAGRFGVRYGRKIRLLVSDIEKMQKKRHECPSCNKFAVKRISAAIWTCRACGIKFSGGAYTPASMRLEPVAQAESIKLAKKVIEVAKPAKKRDKFKGRQKPKQEKKKEKEEIKVKKDKGK